MTKLSQKLLGATAFMALAAGTASAQGYYDRDRSDSAPKPDVIDQVQLGDVWSDVNVHVPSSTGNIITSSAAIGNTATAIVDRGAIDADIDQINRGDTFADTNIWAGRVDGDVISATSATGNAAYVGNWYGDSRANVNQTNTGTTTATSNVDVQDAWAVSTSATAVANASQVETDFGNRGDTFVEQNSNGSVFAGSVATLGYVEGTAQNTAIAAGNSADSFYDRAGYVNDTVVQRTADNTEIVSSAQTYVDDAQNVITTSAAVGNQFNGAQNYSDVSFGANGSESFQGNGANVIATADTTVDYYAGFSSTSASGVGNSFAVSGLGGSTHTDVIQSNSGNVISDVRVNTGDFGGGIGQVNATSIGNSFSSVVQDGNQRASAIQTNFGNTIASASIRTGRAGDVIATSTAIGNSATIETRANNNGR